MRNDDLRYIYRNSIKILQRLTIVSEKEMAYRPSKKEYDWLDVNDLPVINNENICKKCKCLVNSTEETK